MWSLRNLFCARLYIICVYEWNLVYIYSAIWSHVTWLADLSLPAQCVLFLEMLKRERCSWIRLRSDTSSLAMSMRPDWTCFSFPLANQNMQERQVERQSYFAWIITCDCYIDVALAERTRTVSLLNLTESEVQTASEVSGLRTVYSWNKWVSSKFCGKPYVFCFSSHSLLFFLLSCQREECYGLFFFSPWKLCCKWQRQHQFPFGNELFSLMCALEQEGLKFLSSSMSFAVRWERGDIRFVILWWS